MHGMHELRDEARGRKTVESEEEKSPPQPIQGTPRFEDAEKEFAGQINVSRAVEGMSRIQEKMR